MQILNKNGNSGKVGTAKNPESFFQQMIATPNPLNPREVIVNLIPGSGIPMRDYFAAKIAASFATDLDQENFASIARDSYRLADSMLKARNEVYNDSQFHEDHYGPDYSLPK